MNSNKHIKKLLYVLAIFVFACNSEEANDCFQTTGNIIEQQVEVSSFEKILVHRNIELIIKEAPDYKVTIEAGENLLSDINIEVIGDRLILTDNNNCNYVRDYRSTKVFVETPNLTEIRSSTQYEISSNGVLNFNELTLFSEDFNGEGEFTIGDFRLHVNAQDITIVSNNLAFFYLQGNVANLFVGFYAGAGRFEGENLIAQNVSVYHRGSNDMLVNPQQTLTGELRGTGNLISVNQPPLVDVERIYTGQLIFN